MVRTKCYYSRFALCLRNSLPTQGLTIGKRTATTAKIYVPNQGWSAAFIETDFMDGLR